MNKVFAFIFCKPLIFQLALLLAVSAIIQLVTLLRRSKLNSKIHRINGWIMLAIVFVHAFLGFAKYFGLYVALPFPGCP